MEFRISSPKNLGPPGEGGLKLFGYFPLRPDADWDSETMYMKFIDQPALTMKCIDSVISKNHRETRNSENGKFDFDPPYEKKFKISRLPFERAPFTLELLLQKNSKKVIL
jgi:hypothetical protein